MQKQLDRFTYAEKDLLGKGSFGRVYKGKDTHTGDNVAIKIMDMTLFDDEFMIEALKTEIKIMKELQHPHIVRMIDVFGDSKQTVIVIELCDGGDLRSFIQKNGGMLEEQIAQDVLQQLMAGFQEMTNRGYIHRDIKPENSLIKNNVHKVADFGFATKADIAGRQLIQDCVGTPLYMAPQLLERRPYTAKCDIWSIGIMAYEMIYGRQPWPCRDCNSYLLNMKCQPLKFPFEKPVSEQYKDFIRKCLTIDEEKRVGWKEVFQHPVLIINQQERKYDQKAIDEESKKILANIQKIVQARGLDVYQQFQQFDVDKGGSLDGAEFYKFLEQLDPRLTSKEAGHLFKLLDNNGDGKITLEEFKNIFCNYDFSDLTDVAERIITDLKEIIKANNLNLADIFRNFDADKQGDLDFQEFTKLIKVIAPAIKPDEVQKIFVKFDKNKDKKICYDEFKRELSYGTDQDSQFNPKKEKALKVVEELKRIQKQHNVKIEQIFSNFDKNNSKVLELPEFRKLCEVMDKSLDAGEQEIVFQLFDKKGQGYVTLEQFAAAFA